MEDECPDTVQKWTSTTRLNQKKAISIIFINPLLTSWPVFPAESLNFIDIISVDLQSLLAQQWFRPCLANHPTLCLLIEYLFCKPSYCAQLSLNNPIYISRMYNNCLFPSHSLIFLGHPFPRNEKLKDHTSDLFDGDGLRTSKGT